MKKKILTLAAVVTLPFILLVMYLLASMASYSNTYDEIVSNMTVANNYNLNFKEEMDESLYKLVVGYVTLDTIETDKSLKNPYTLIDELRSEFTRLTAITTESESKLWLLSEMWATGGLTNNFQGDVWITRLRRNCLYSEKGRLFSLLYMD